MMPSLGPWLGLLVPHAIMLTIALTVFLAANRWQRATSVLILVAIVVALVSLACAAFIVDSDHAVYWLMTGLVLLVLGLPACIPYAVGIQEPGAAVTPAGIVDCLRLFAAFLFDPCLDHRPSEPARQIGRVAKTLVAYVAGCWVVMIVVSAVAFLAGPPGSFR
jgi:hypothetical protein